MTKPNYTVTRIVVTQTYEPRTIQFNLTSLDQLNLFHDLINMMDQVIDLEPPTALELQFQSAPTTFSTTTFAAALYVIGGNILGWKLLADKLKALSTLHTDNQFKALVIPPPTIGIKLPIHNRDQATAVILLFGMCYNRVRVVLNGYNSSSLHSVLSKNIPIPCILDAYDSLVPVDQWDNFVSELMSM